MTVAIVGLTKHFLTDATLHSKVLAAISEVILHRWKIDVRRRAVFVKRSIGFHSCELMALDAASKINFQKRFVSGKLIDERNTEQRNADQRDFHLLSSVHGLDWLVHSSRIERTLVDNDSIWTDCAYYVCLVGETIDRECKHWIKKIDDSPHCTTAIIRLLDLTAISEISPALHYSLQIPGICSL